MAAFYLVGLSMECFMGKFGISDLSVTVFLSRLFFALLRKDLNFLDTTNSSSLEVASDFPLFLTYVLINFSYITSTMELFEKNAFL